MADQTHRANRPVTSSVDPAYSSPEYLEKRRLALAQLQTPTDLDHHDPKHPAGHADAIRTSTRLTSYTKCNQGKVAMDITPQDVIDVMNAAGVRNWVLMGLHGYVGYLPSPRATQDVDVMVSYQEGKRARKAIAEKWPELVVRELSQVIRFMDPSDLDPDGHPKPIVDLMFPWAPFQELILKEYVVVDDRTQHRLPTVEAALVSKYAAMLSPHRERDRKEQDAVDFRRLVKANRDQIQGEPLRRLARLVWEDGADEIERFIQIALSDTPLPI